MYNKIHPSKVILFGSVAKGIFKETSEIDLCVVQDTDNKRKWLTDMYVENESEISFDIILYINEEWNECIKDTVAFAYQINNTGVTIYGWYIKMWGMGRKDK